MDSDIRRLELKASLGGSQERAALAIAERRSGSGITMPDAELQVLKVALHAPWVDITTWAAVRVGHLIHIVYPGKLDELSFARPWMLKGGIGRLAFKDSYTRKLAHDFHQMLKAWVVSDALTTVVERVIPRLIDVDVRTLETITLTTERRRRTWTVEHVRLAVGLDPIEPSSAEPPEIFEVMVGRCHTQGCSYDDARTRKCGHRLCFNCNRTHTC